MIQILGSRAVIKFIWSTIAIYIQIAEIALPITVGVLLIEGIVFWAEVLLIVEPISIDVVITLISIPISILITLAGVVHLGTVIVVLRDIISIGIFITGGPLKA